MLSNRHVIADSASVQLVRLLTLHKDALVYLLLQGTDYSKRKRKTRITERSITEQ